MVSHISGAKAFPTLGYRGWGWGKLWLKVADLKITCAQS